ncbi:GNAT family N-acetyltransferase [Mobilitalea sibirica]|uniref:GNAT family N-acetyltransferase n=1 Tax=Mobilitalea sibirica TaxID=1462919 RepID=A0A8J7KTP3_9FIRM|nr:GNAT family N-acetyltransferase [Mobilitalea sibirica]MBH1941601.1 GNAT family N-acetyltransferase [Mobilitalea sibirica]
METERLILRAARPGDVNEIFELRNSEYVLKYNCMSKLTAEEVQEMVIKDMESDSVYYIELKDAQKIIGVIGIDPDTLRYGVNSLSASYYLGEEYSSKGYMTEALREIIRYVFEEKQTEVLSVRVFKDNMASRRLVEKLGFINEGCIRRCVKGYQDIIYDDMIYSILKEEYEMRNGVNIFN